MKTNFPTGFDALLASDHGADTKKFVARLNQLREQYISETSA